jgi:hypothetical protein
MEPYYHNYCEDFVILRSLMLFEFHLKSELRKLLVSLLEARVLVFVTCLSQVGV